MDTFYRRPLPDGLVAFSSPEGRRLFAEALADGGMEAWFPLAEHFHTQAEPAYCALGSLVVALNALAIDPGRTWKGPWRWYSEELLDCCDPLEVVRERGTTIDQLACLARCNGATADVRRASDFGVDALREDLARAGAEQLVVASFGRRALGQTGDGHFSPIGGLHRARDLALVLDVARFKYPPFWVPVPALHAAMDTIDPATGRSRGWVLLARDGTSPARSWRIRSEGPGWRERVGALVRAVGEASRSAPDLRGVEAAVAQGDALDALSPCDPDAAARLPRSRLLVLAVPPEVLGSPALLRERDAARATLGPADRAEVDRLAAQLAALG